MQYMDSAKTFALKVSQTSSELLGLLPDYVWPEITIRPPTIALVAKLLRQVKNNRDGNAVKLPSQRHDWLAGLGLHIRGVNYYQLARGESLRRNVIQDIERIVRGRLAILS